MKKIVYLAFVLLTLNSCKKSFTCECNGNKEVVEIVENNGSVSTDTTTKTIFDSEVFREKNENDAFAKCSNKKNIILSELTSSQTKVDVDCSLR